MSEAAQFATIPLDNPLWRHACQFYAQPGIEQILLTLQDEHGADINQILQAHWLGSEGKAWDQGCVSEEYLLWMEQQIQPLRKIRRDMKQQWVVERGAAFEDFRQQVKKLELQAEQYGLALLYLAGQQQPSSVEGKLVQENFSRYARSLGIPDSSFSELIK